MTKTLSYSLLALLILSGCKTQPTPKKQDSLKSNKEVIISLDNNISVEETTMKELLTKDPVYADKNKKTAIIENKNSDAFTKKPLFLEPIFTKVEIMPYETDNGLYHEQQSVWVKIRKEEIVIKSNPDAQNLFSTQKSVLNY